jgi:hypothetical protein
MSETTERNPNSALYWYPRIDGVAGDLPVSVPETEFVEYEFTDSFKLIDGEVPETLPWGEFVAAAREVGWPAFIRTDQKSVKHAGPGAYRAEEPDDVPTIVAVLTDHHVKAQRHPAALMVREFVDINSLFRAFDGLPIGRELRVFATPDEAICEHFYWPEGAIEDGRGTPTTMDGERELSEDEWRQKLSILSKISLGDREHLRVAATDAALALNTAGAVPEDTVWSVDFAQDADGDWWLIDAALAEDSWHPDDCPIPTEDTSE